MVWPSVPKPEAPCPQQKRPGRSFGLRSVNQARWVTDLTSLLSQPQPSQLQSSAPAPAILVTTGDTDLPPPAVQLQSQQSSAVVFNLPTAPDPTTLAVKGEHFEDSQMDTDLPCTPPLPDSLTQKCIHWAYQD
ncbi:uncharacterized protein ACWYII_022359 [Salvelinus alpinus]